jgi:hypothetical protein
MATMKKAAKSASKKAVVEKKTGEKYSSKSSKMKHEKGEGLKEMMKEYGPKKAFAMMKAKAKSITKKK